MSSDLPNEFNAAFTISARIGSGSYGTVYKAIKKAQHSSEVVAIKCLRKGSLSASSRDSIIAEISALKKLHHVHIVAMHDFRWDATHIFIIMEYCDGGDLASYLKRHRVVAEMTARSFLQQLASALAYMQHRQVSHLDLKPSNILLTAPASLKIADFGFAQHWRESRRAEEVRGSLLYMAPEMVVHRSFDHKADLWSVGVILYECLYGQAPFLSSSLKELHDKISSDQPIVLPDQPRVSTQCKHLIGGLLFRDPSHRLSFHAFIHHPFLHLPSLLQLATELTNKAARLRYQGDTQASLDTYCEALQCYVDAIKCEKDENKKEKLRKKVNEHIEKAEELKATLNSLQPLQDHHQEALEQPLQPMQELELLWRESEQMRGALKVVESAEAKFEMDDLKSAVQRYEAAIGVMLKLLKDEPPGRRRDLLHSQLDAWLTRASAIKEQLARTKMADDAHDDDAPDKAPCLLQ